MTDPRTSRNACAAITLSWVTWCRPCGSLPPCCAGFLTRCRKSWCQTDTPNWRCACMFAGRLAGSRCDWLALVRLAWTIWTYWIYWIYWYIYMIYWTSVGPGQWTPKQVAGARAISSQVYQSKNPMKTYHQIHQSQILQIYEASAKPREGNGDVGHRPQPGPFVARPS